MFVQVIKGRVKDVGGMRKLSDRWQEELRPGATGYLGTTVGVAADGRFITFVRFDAAEAARRNSERPEQGAWWDEMSQHLDGEPTYVESDDVETVLGGGSGEAGFVQFWEATVPDRAKLAALEEKALSRLRTLRPEVLGGIRVWNGDRCIDATYFRSEAEARAGEQAMGSDPEMAELLPQWQQLSSDEEWLDASDPWLHSA